ncbi:MAG: prolyl oligopeptidase family serine peptidase [Acidimicrobiales bacterium]
MAKTAPCGTWESPIAATTLVEDRLRLSDLVVSGDEVYWSEGRPFEGGRVCLVKSDAAGNCSDLIPEGYSARTTVHEYGGRCFAVHEGVVYFSNFDDQRLYRVAPGESPEPITAAPLEKWGVRYAAPVVSLDGHYIYCVRERHGSEVTNDIVVLRVDGEAEARVVAAGHDFFGAPSLSPDGRRIAWVCWDHPRMPWDGTELWEAEVGSDGLPVAPRLVAGGPAESVAQPKYSPGGWLHFVSDRTGWWNIYADTGDPTAPNPLCQAEHDFAEPDWAFGLSSYGFCPDGSPDGCLVATWIDGGVFKLGILPIGAGAAGLQRLEMPFNEFRYVSTDGGRLAAILGSPAIPPCVALIQLPGGEVTVRRSSSALVIDEGYLSEPEAFEFPTEEGRTAHALVYRPKNRDYEVPAGELPPLVVVAHGGPTSMARPGLSEMVQYWTSRGFAVADVNYGGSSGYGREYRARLKGKWGVVDLDDCGSAGRHLARTGVVDGKRMVVRGGSAGGYVVLCSAVFRDVFVAGASYFGVSDLSALAIHTHKFESRYGDELVAPWPAGADVYESRSPAVHAAELHMPLILFQGLEDAVVPPAQAEVMVEVLRKKGIPFAYLAFEGEQHGFRQAASIVRSIEAELCFYGCVLGFQPAGDIEPVEIENRAALGSIAPSPAEAPGPTPAPPGARAPALPARPPGDPGPPMSAAEWLERFAARLGVDPPAESEVEAILGLAGTAAHASERTAAPVAAWLVAKAGATAAEGLAAARALAKEAEDPT